MKRKKLTINKLAFGNLKARKKQYSLMIIGIILAMIFTSAAMFFAVCNEDSAEQLKWRSVGKQDYILRKCDGFDIEPFVKDGSVRSYATFEVIAYGYSPDDDYDDGMGIAVHNDKSRELSCFYFLEGRYPETENEIAIESDALYRMNITDAEVGDEITLNLHAASGDGFLEKETQKTYSLSGILKDRRYIYEEYEGLNFGKESPGYPAAIVYDGAEVEVGGKPEIIALVDFNHEERIRIGINSVYRNNEALKNAYKEYLYQNGVEALLPDSVFDFDNENIYEGYWIDTRGYSAADNYTFYELKTVTTLGTVLAVVLAIASCFGVVNAFNTNLQERRKQIGMLRAVGATKRQIIKVFGREALLISFICAPISVAVAYFGLKLFSYLMGEVFIFEPEWYITIIIGIVGILFVIAAALIPLSYAARVTPMQAIRNTELGRKMKNKKIKSVKDFNAQKLISKRSLVFHRFRQVSVSIILIATIIISCFCVSLLEYSVNSYSYDYDYRIFKDKADDGLSTAFANFYYDYDDMLNDGDIDMITSNRYIGSAKGKMELAVNWLVDGEYPGYLKLAEFNRPENCDKYEYMLETHKETPEEIIEIYNTMNYSDSYKELMEVVGYETEPFGTKIETESAENIKTLEKYLLDGKIDIEKINSGEEIILVAPEEIVYEVAYSKDGYHTSIGKHYINNGLRKYTDVNDYVEILREKMPFKAGQSIKLSILINKDRDNNVLPEYEKAYDYKYSRYDREVKIGAIVYQGYFDSQILSQRPSFITTNEGLSEFGCPLKYYFIDATANQEITPEIEESLDAFFRAADYDAYSEYRLKESNKTELIATVAGIASIILLLFCIAASLVNNALTAKIREGKREIGTLRAVGASAKELTMIYIHQLLSMFGMGCGLGFGIYTAVFFSAKLICLYALHMEFPFEFRILTAAAICLILFAICSLNLYSKIKKQMKYSIVENIREL